MDEQKIHFSEYKFDTIPYKFNKQALETKIQTKNDENIEKSKNACNRIDLVINETIQECSDIAEKIKKTHAENFGMQTELRNLKKKEEQLLNTSFDLKEALKTTCKITFVQNNEEFRALTQKIQTNLNFKLKLMQCQENLNLWTATFLFNVCDESEVHYFVVTSYNTKNESFTLREIQPKPIRFAEMTKFLMDTNDITGLLYNCWKYFSMISSRNSNTHRK